MKRHHLEQFTLRDMLGFVFGGWAMVLWIPVTVLLVLVALIRAL